jgi:hypothetical protein
MIYESKLFGLAGFWGLFFYRWCALSKASQQLCPQRLPNNDGFASNGVKHTSADKMRAEFLRSVVSSNTYYSIPNGVGRRFFLVLDIVLDSKKFLHLVRVGPFVIRTLVQELECWAQRPHGCDVYPNDSTAMIDLFKLGPFDELRRDMRVWEAQASDCQGCLFLQNDRVAVPELGPEGLLSLSCPGLLVIEECLRLGWYSKRISCDRHSKHCLSQPLA